MFVAPLLSVRPFTFHEPGFRQAAVRPSAMIRGDPRLVKEGRRLLSMKMTHYLRPMLIIRPGGFL